MNHAKREDAQLHRAADLVAHVRPLFIGHGPEVQGAALVELVALLIAGHHPDSRESVLALHLETVRRMVPVVEREIFGPAGHPGNVQ